MKCAIATLITALTEENVKKSNEKTPPQQKNQKAGLGGVSNKLMKIVIMSPR